MNIMKLHSMVGKVFVDAKHIVAVQELPNPYGDEGNEVRIYTLGNMPPISMTNVKVEDILEAWSLSKDA